MSGVILAALMTLASSAEDEEELIPVTLESYEIALQRDDELQIITVGIEGQILKSTYAWGGGVMPMTRDLGLQAEALATQLAELGWQRSDHS